ncbi:hypothetical protein TWF481_002407 [Arthrobotrys musiformis]|uniref:Arb2 domain-containing protein n=3 Tax=Arthrobotrys musiformis TaxID=47236 RepID=A0AAV9VUQ5_9PEZI
MFRRIKPIEHREEVDFPADFKKLGYFINSQDQIRQIEKPSEGFEYYVHRVERVNEKRREAMDECIRRVLDARFVEEGLTKHFLPPGSDPASDPCVPILISNDLDDVEKVLVVIGNTYDDLGVWSVREMEGLGVNHGSMISTIQTAKKEKFGFAILNCGQNVYSPEMGRAVTYRSWKAATKPSPHIDEVKNRVPGHENVQKHVNSVLEELKGRLIGKKKKKIYFLTYGWGCWGLVKYMNVNFAEWKSSIEAIIAVESTHTAADVISSDLRHFLTTRGRAYIVHSDPPGTFIPDKRFICQTFSTAQIYSETIIPNAWKDVMLPWFKRVEEDPEGCNPVMLVDWESVERLKEEWGGYSAKPKDTIDPNKWAFDDEEYSDENNDHDREQKLKEGGTVFGEEGLEDMVDLRDAEQAAKANRALQENERPRTVTGDGLKEMGVGKAAPSA